MTTPAQRLDLQGVWTRFTPARSYRWDPGNKAVLKSAVIPERVDVDTHLVHEAGQLLNLCRV
jgi:hypothetical protein